MSRSPSLRYRAGRVLIDLATADLVDGEGRSLRAQPKVTQLLLFLAERHGRVVSREEILAGVWAGRIVEPNALNQVVAQARQLLGDEARSVLVTHARRGFQLCAEAIEMDGRSHDDPGADPLDSALEPPNVARPLPEQGVTGDSEGASRPGTPLLRRRTFLLLGVVLLTSVALVLRDPPAPGAASAPQLRIDPALPEALQSLLVEVAKPAGWEVRKDASAASPGPTGIALRSTASADGVVWVEASGARAVPPHALLPELLPRLRPGAAVATRDDRSDRLDALFLAEDDFGPLMKSLQRRLANEPESRSAWHDLRTLAQLGGQADVAAFLDLDSLRDAPADVNLDGASPSSKAERLRTLFDETSAMADEAAAASALATGCSRDWIAPDSWASGACSLELALAQLRARDFSNYAGHLALAASAFRAAGDARSADLADYLRSMLSSDYSGAINVEAVSRLSDSRAIGLVLRPLAVQNPELAYPLAEAVLGSPWIATRPAEKADVLVAMGWSARLAEDPAIPTRFSDFLDRQLAAENPVVPVDLLRALSMQVAASSGEVGSALALRREIAAWRFPAMRCQTYDALISSGDSDLALTDASDCASRREDPAYRSNMAGFVGWVAMIATQRYRGDEEQALRELRDAVEAFAQEPAEQLNYPSIASGLFIQAWAMRQGGLAAAVCRASPSARAVCEGEDHQSLLLADRAPATLGRQQFVPVEYREFAAGSFRMELYLEQQRTGVCQLPREESDRLKASFDARGNVVMRDFLAAIEDDCAAGRRSAYLDAWRAREFAY